MRRVTALTVCCALLLVLAGCSGAGSAGGGDGGGGDVAREEAAAATGTPMAEEADTASDAASGSAEGGSAGSGQVRAQVSERLLVYEATVVLEVDDFEATRADLAAIARERGGYVGDSRRRLRGEGNRTWTTGRLVLRVPRGNYSGAIEAVQAQGTVLRFEQSTTDVTDRVVDLRARLESLRAERERLRELYDRANDTEEVLAVQRELSSVQTEIERTEARLRALERRVAYSTITVEVREPRPDEPRTEPPAWYETSVVTAFLASVDGVVILGRSLVVLTAYAVPYLAVLGVPAVGAALAYRRYRREPPQDS